MSARLAALEILRSGSELPLREVEGAARRHGLDGRDRALLRRLVGSEVRYRGTLLALVHRFARGKPSPDLSALLRLGFTQIFLMDRIPDHAAVSETVAATVEVLGLSKGRYVNAVLREALRERREGSSGDPRRDLVGRPWHLSEPLFRDPDEHPLLWAEDALNLPAPLMKAWEKRMGREPAWALARDLLDEAPLSLRCLGPRVELGAELAALDVPARPGAHPAILLADAEHTEAVLASPAFQAGRLTAQGETALRAAELVEARPDERILDLCAAPGGKTAVLAGAGARVVASDVDARRLERARETIERLHLAERVTWTEAARLDPEGPFDAVLVDAPCSNTGVLAQRPEARWRYGPRTRASLGELQRHLLGTAAERVRPLGRLVYSTCSLEPEENARRVAEFLSKDPRFELEAQFEALPAPRAPAGPTDGGYAARLRRRP